MVANGNDYESEPRAFHSEGAAAGTLPILAYSPVYAYAVNNYPTTPTAVGTARAINSEPAMGHHHGVFDESLEKLSSEISAMQAGSGCEPACIASKPFGRTGCPDSDLTPGV